jgi:hypothetical protein
MLADPVVLTGLYRRLLFSDIDKAFDTTWQSGLLYILPELEFLASLNKITASFLTERKLKVFVEGKFSAPRKIMAGVPQGSILAPYCT